MQQSERKRLRRQMRRQRRALSPGERLAAAGRLARRLRAMNELHRARRVALYLPADGELDPRPALLDTFAHKGLYLPVLDPMRPGVLRFAPWRPGVPMTTNRFGITEPLYRYGDLAPVWSLNMILMPLVAWDRQGNRLGMGGGFYDRTLDPRQRWPVRPRLVGVGYRFQEVPELDTARWDVPLDAVVTD